MLNTINALIKEKKLRKKDIAKQIGVSPVTLSRNLNGTSEMQLSTLEAIIKTIGEGEVYRRLLERLEVIEWKTMDVQGSSTWGVFLINDKPVYVGLIEGNQLTLYVRDITNIQNIKKIENCFKDVKVNDFKEDINIVNMWVYQYERKNL